MSENRPARQPAVSSSLNSTPRAVATAALVCAVLPGLWAAPAAAQSGVYVAPSQAPAAWLEQLAPEDSEPLKGWLTFLPPSFDARLRWIDPTSETRRIDRPKWSDWYGKVVVMQSFSHGDEASIKRLNEVAEVVNGFSEIDVQFIALHTPDRGRAATSFIYRNDEWKHLTAIDVIGEYCDLLGVYRTPVNIVIGRNGAVRYVGLHPSGLREAIDHLLEEDAHAAPCRGSRPVSAGSSAGGGFPAHNPQPRANNLQGRRAPDFFVQSWANVEPDQIDGRVNVIKFWRTSCPHCITAIPKTSALAQKYAGRVNFIDITHENQNTLVQGLTQRRRPLETIAHPIAIDTSSRMRVAVGSQVVPNAMIVDSDWIVRWQGNPAQITEQMLDQILAADGAAGGSDIVRRWASSEAAVVSDRVRPVEARPLTEAPRLGRSPQARPQQRPADQRTAPQAAGAGGYPQHNPQPRARNLQGQPGPEFAVESWVTPAPDKIEGRINVVKFWRTGCPHCINAIPKTSEMAQKFAGRVNFIDITHENQAALQQGLAQRRVSLDSVNQSIAIDTGSRLQKAVAPQGVPNAIVFDKNWIVRWQGHPNGVTDDLLEQILVADAAGVAVAPAARPVRQADAPAGYPQHNSQPRARNLQGQPGPEFAVESWVTAAPDEIYGRVNVVKFWRTGCPHCITAIPKTSEMAQKFAGRVNFIDITHENQAALQQGLAQRRVSLDSLSQSVAIDTGSRLQKAVAPQGVPNAIVFDKNWIVRWQGHPSGITESLLEQILQADAQAPDQPRAAQPTAPRVEVRTASTRRRIEFGPAEFPPVEGEAGAAVDFRGKPGPEFHVQQWVTAQPMRVGGKVTVIEFFRTSCPHCRRAIDKLNDYNVQFGGIVDFITLSNESESVFNSGLTQHQLSTRSFNHFVALDPAQTMQRAVSPRGVPHAIVLDSDWVVRWQGNPHSLTGEILEQIVKADAWKRRQGSS